MERISRRLFTRRVAAASLLPVLAARSGAQTQAPAPAGPDAVAGYTPDPLEREAMNRFLADQEKGLAPLRTVALANGIAPATVFRTLPSADMPNPGKSPRNRGGPEK